MRTIKQRKRKASAAMTPGSETVTVSRDMAKNGEVYLFVYLATEFTEADRTSLLRHSPQRPASTIRLDLEASEDMLLGPWP